MTLSRSRLQADDNMKCLGSSRENSGLRDRLECHEPCGYRGGAEQTLWGRAQCILALPWDREISCDQHHGEWGSRLSTLSFKGGASRICIGRRVAGFET